MKNALVEFEVPNDFTSQMLRKLFDCLEDKAVIAKAIAIPDNKMTSSPVISDSILTMKEYLELITGNNYDGLKPEAEEDTFNAVAEELDYSIWSYPLSEIDHITENELKVALVEYHYVDNGKLSKETRWFEIPQNI